LRVAKIRIEPAAQAVDEGQRLHAGQIVHPHDGFGKLAVAQAVGPPNAIQQAAVQWRRA